MIQTGLERFLKEHLIMLKGKNFGLMANHTSVTSSLKHSVDALQERGFTPARIFSPEHGFRGKVKAEREVGSSVDEGTGIPIESLFPFDESRFFEATVELDLLLFDMQDIGARFYTYIDLIAYGLRASKEHRIPFIVLDRPNPVGGIIAEGPLSRQGVAASFSPSGLPVRHGLTVGEIAMELNQTIGGRLEVITMKGWERAMHYKETGLPWVPPSPNANVMEMPRFYYGLALLDSINLSLGAGTDKPFQQFGAPWLDAGKFIRSLTARKADGVVLEAVTFVPSQGDYENERCEGIRFHPVSENWGAMALAGHIFEVLRDEHPSLVLWKNKDERYWSDFIYGTEGLRLSYIQGNSVIAQFRRDSLQSQAFLEFQSKKLYT
ncbi:DUF1343 domain-containing protein [Bacillus sp. H-16]|uniref:exo-beta-N-acetylmuramidase NamZ family protein n=1 Tax=Alteribacter salitolerans TaxID=2912333 RepID=UPI001963CC24|nr:DUF1343 domain-containing protein [Alteribacter salitolerans]MBM7094847.1 DUF1343 domain-containing protein [Alteribacter salitolerans]